VNVSLFAVGDCCGCPAKVLLIADNLCLPQQLLVLKRRKPLAVTQGCGPAILISSMSAVRLAGEPLCAL
jgi:hypothetical protein